MESFFTTFVAFTGLFCTAGPDLRLLYDQKRQPSIDTSTYDFVIVGAGSSGRVYISLI